MTKYYAFNIISWSLLTATIIGLIVLYIAWHRRKSLTARYLFYLEVGVVLWTFAAIFEMAAKTVPLKLFWTQVTYLGIVSVPILYFLLALAFGNHTRFLQKKYIVLLSIIPLFSFFAVLTNNWHYMFYTSIVINEDNIGIYAHGKLFWIYTAYAYLFLIGGVLVFLRTLFQLHSYYKTQIILLLVGMLFPFAGNIIYVFDFNPIPGMEWTPIAFILSGILLAIGIFRFQLLNLIPTARNKLIDTMPDALLVLDGNGKVADVNPAMNHILKSQPKKTLGMGVSDVLGFWKELENIVLSDKETGTRLYRTMDGEERCFDLQIRYLFNALNQYTGKIITLRDITEHTAAKKQLKESEDRYRNLINSAPIAIGVHRNFKWLMLNDRAVTLLDYNNEDELIGEPILNIIHPDIRKEIGSRIQKAIENEQDLPPLEERLITKNGKTVYAIISATQINYMDEPAIQVVALDITDLRKVQKDRDYYISLLETVNYSIYQFMTASVWQDVAQDVIEQIGKRMDVNRVYIFKNRVSDDKSILTTQIHEWVSEGITSQSGNPELVDFPYVEGGMSRWINTLSEGEIISGHVKDFPPKEKEILVPQDITSILVVPVFVDEKWWGFIGFDQCTYERNWSQSEINILKSSASAMGSAIKRQRDAVLLRENEQKYRTLFQTNPDALFLIDIKNQKIIDVNSSAEKLYGYTKEELLGLRLEQITANKQPMITDKVDTSRGEMVKASLQYHIKKDGNPVPVDITSTYFELDGNPMVIATVRDVSERKKAEDQLSRLSKFNKNIVDSAPVGIVTVDTKGSVTSANKAFLTIVGSPGIEETMKLGMNIKELKKAGISDIYQSALDIGKPFELNKIPYTSHWGRELVINLKGVPQKTNGKLTGYIIVVDDITEIYQAEISLRESEVQFRTLFENIPVGLGLADMQGNILAFNDAMLKPGGYTREDIEKIGNVSALFNSSYDREKVFTIAQEKGIVSEYELRFKRKDGGYYDALLSLTRTRIRGEDYWLSIVEDITERNWLNKANNIVYRISEASHTALSLDDLYKEIHTLIGELIPANNFYIALYESDNHRLSFPYFVDEFDPKPDPQDAGKGLTEYVLKTQKSILVTPEMFEDLTKSGEVNTIGSNSIDWLGSPLKVENKAIGVVVVQTYSEDIRLSDRDLNVLEFVSDQIANTINRFKGEKALRISEARLREAQSISQLGSWELDLQTNILTWSNEVYHLFDIKRENFDHTYSAFLKIILPEDREKVDRTFQKHFKSGKRFDVQHRIMVRNNKIKYMHERCETEFDADGKPLRSIGTVQDITSQIEFQLKLEEARIRAEQASRVKTLFLANMSHEIRTPLNSILGFNDIIRDNIKNKVDKDIVSLFDTINASGQRLMRTVHEILDLSQIETGTYDVHKEVIDLKSIVSHVLHEAESFAINKSLELEFNCDIDSAMVHADKYGVSQSVMNIVDNAIKYTREGHIQVSLEQNNAQYILSIVDTGIGISSKYIDRIFDAFTQESEGYTKKFQGIGLGMAITKRHLDMNGIDIQVKSKKNAGTSFVLTFESYDQSLTDNTPEESPDEDDQLQLKGLSILSLEDDPESQKLLLNYLGNDHLLHAASNVKQAKKVLDTQSIDLALIDLKLPGKEDGLDMVHFMRKSVQWKNTPIIIISAHAFKSEKKKCLDAGCNEFLTKPLKQSVLLKAMHHHLSN